MQFNNIVEERVTRGHLYYNKIYRNIHHCTSAEDLKKLEGVLHFIVHIDNAMDIDHDDQNLKEKGNNVLSDELVDIVIIVKRDIKADVHTAIAALLYPFVEKNICTIEDIHNIFDDKVVNIMQCLQHSAHFIVNEKNVWVYQEEIDANTPNIKALLIKLAYNFYILQCLSRNNAREEKFATPVFEAIHFYIPLAHRLRLYRIISGLEDICFKFRCPLEYYAIASKLKESQIKRQVVVEKFISAMKSILTEHGIQCEIKGRAKSIYSIWNKQNKLKMPFNDIHDLLAIRIIIKNIKSIEDERIVCWQVYHIITNVYAPQVAKMRDWISIPKKNGYEALHTTITKDNRLIEIQIRTERMDDIAEKGDAAHWKYKEQYS